MAITIQVYPQYSPRIIEIKAPTVSASVQEIVDACREWEDSWVGMPFPNLIDAAGKEDLGGGVKVGITATLQNAQIAFEAQGASDAAGSVTTTDSTGRILNDSTATFITDGIVPGDSVLNTSDGSIATVLSVNSETQLTTFGLQDGIDNQFTSGDTYKIWNKIQCEVSGGNLVAVNESNTTISAFLPTAYTHVVRTSSSSATLQEQADIQYSSYGGGVSIDVTSTYTGTEYPVGTPRQPVNNLEDAHLIAEERGFVHFFISGDLTISTGSYIDGYIFNGQSTELTTITILDAADVTNAEFRDCTITGILDGGNTLKHCVIQTLNYIEGEVHDSILSGTVTLGDSGVAHFLDCYSGTPGLGTPIIDMAGSGMALAMRNYNGGIELQNKTGTDQVSLDFGSGQVILDSTVTNGTIVIRGDATVTDNSTGATVLDQTTMTNITEAKNKAALAAALSA